VNQGVTRYGEIFREMFAGNAYSLPGIDCTADSSRDKNSRFDSR
jgi:hypothetical protein